MAVSHQNQFVFVHVPKCAGTSIEGLLSKWTTLELMAPNKVDNSYIERNRLGQIAQLHKLERHFGSSDIRRMIGEEKFTRYYKFAVIRNPFARVLSFYKFATRIANPDTSKLQVQLAKEAKSFGEFVARLREYPSMTPFFEQHLYICDTDGSLEIDDVIRMESLDDEMKRVIPKLGFGSLRQRMAWKFGLRPYPTIGRLNASGHDPHKYRDEYTAASRKIVEEASRVDLDRFGYEF